MIFEGIVAILLIMLCFTLYVMIASSGDKTNNWEIAGSGPVSNIHLGDDGTLYAFVGQTGNTVYAIDENGSVRWKLDVPDKWRVYNDYWRSGPNIYDAYSSSPVGGPVFATDNGTLYLYVRESGPASSTNGGLPPSGLRLEERLMAISPDGSVEWDALLGNYSEPYSDVNLYVWNGTIYAYNDYKLTLFNRMGAVVYSIDRVSDAPAIDEDGIIYLSVARPQETYPGFNEPMGFLRAYYPNGTLYWAKELSAIRPDVAEDLRHTYGTLPIYQHGILYVPIQDGVVALYTNGTTRWSVFMRDSGASLFRDLPIDGQDRLYLQYYKNYKNGVLNLMILGQDGRQIPGGEAVGYDNQFARGDPGEGRIYDFAGLVYDNRSSLDNLVTYRIVAHDMASGSNDWTFTVPLEKTGRAIISKGNAGMLDPGVPGSDVSFVTIMMSGNGTRRDIESISALNIMPGKGRVYISLFTANYEALLATAPSRCEYSSGIYALDKNGALLWYKPTDSLVTAMAANNSTIYYGTRSGEIVSTQMNGIAGGIAFLAIAYVFIRFFLVGAVARAKDRLDKNGNRNGVLKYIKDNPGSTLREVSRGMQMNLGTVRYHMFILKLNHRIVSYMADDKHVRYFLNSNSYSKEEQFIISMMKRDGVRKILELLIEKPGLTNIELSGELKLQESATSRYMKELHEKGIVAREDTGDGHFAYSIRNDYLKAVTLAAGLRQAS